MAEADKECDRLKLKDMLVMPFQRLTKYEILLKAILKNTTCPDKASHKEDLNQMINQVNKFVSAVNTSM